MWGHCPGVWLSLPAAANNSVDKFEVLCWSDIRWAIATLASVISSAIYLLTMQIPLHAHIFKHIVCYSGVLEKDKHDRRSDAHDLVTLTKKHDIGRQHKKQLPLHSRFCMQYCSRSGSCSSIVYCHTSWAHCICHRRASGTMSAPWLGCSKYPSWLDICIISAAHHTEHT